MAGGNGRRVFYGSNMERILLNITHSSDSDCWVWNGTVDRKGYGGVKLGKRARRQAHCLAYEEFIGAIPEGLCVLHRCDNPPCCNPAHLFLGTRGDNVRDSVAKGRFAMGETHYRAMVSREDVLEIRRLRASGVKYSELTARFGIKREGLGNIVRRKTWKHIPAEVN